MTVSWREACDLVEVAMNDSSTHLFAASAGWKYPASMPELVLMAVQVGKKGESVLPWNHAPERASAAEVAAVHAELMDEIRFVKKK